MSSSVIKKYKALCLVLGLVLIMSITGCGKNTTTGNDSESKPQKITVFAAASLTECFTKIGASIKKDKNIEVTYNFAGSQALVTLINQGIKADVFASANIDYMNKLKSEGKVDSSIIFAQNDLVICRNKNSKFQIQGLKDLAKNGVKVIVADKSVPVGSYFYNALDKALKQGTIDAPTHDSIIKNIKSNELDVKSVVSKVALGEADAGVVYRTDINASNKDKLDLIDVKEFSDVKANYPAAVVNSSKQKEAAQEFIDYITKGYGKEILKEYGFKVD